MANSYTSLFAHIIFSTHNREPLLKSEGRGGSGSLDNFPKELSVVLHRL